MGLYEIDHFYILKQEVKGKEKNSLFIGDIIKPWELNSIYSILKTHLLIRTKHLTVYNLMHN